eukprot:2039760-Prymnesium_polylepis.1
MRYLCTPQLSDWASLFFECWDIDRFHTMGICGHTDVRGLTPLGRPGLRVCTLWIRAVARRLCGDPAV